MWFFQNINPFYWRKKATEASAELALAKEELIALRTERSSLLKRNKLLALQYDYPKFNNLASELAVCSDHKLQFEAVEQARQYSPTEQKLLLDMVMLRQQLEYYQLLLREVDVSGGVNAFVHTTNERIANLEGIALLRLQDIQSLTKKLDEKIRACVELEAKNESLAEELEKVKAASDKWFKVVFGYGSNEMTLLNKELWGSTLKLVEFGDEKADRDNT